MFIHVGSVVGYNRLDVVFGCLMLLVAAGIFLAWGSVGFYTCFWFTKKIYGSLKVD